MRAVSGSKLTKRRYRNKRSGSVNPVKKCRACSKHEYLRKLAIYEKNKLNRMELK